MNKLTIPLLSTILLISCTQKTTYQGYIEARYTYLSSLYAGKLEKLYVQKGDQVKEGQTLFALDVTPENLSVKNSTSQLEGAQSTLISQKLAVEQAETSYRIAIEQKRQTADNFDFRKKQFARSQSLLDQKATTQVEFDQTRNNYQQAEKADQIAQKNILQATLSLKQAKENISTSQANINALDANVSKNKWDEVQKVITAPGNGVIFNTYYTKGELVDQRKPVVSILLPENIYALFFIPEIALAPIHIGDSVQISCEMCEKVIPATISYISPTPEYTSPLIYSDHEKNKLVFRIEAHFAVQYSSELKPGLPVTVSLEKKQ